MIRVTALWWKFNFPFKCLERFREESSSILLTIIAFAMVAAQMRKIKFRQIGQSAADSCVVPTVVLTCFQSLEVDGPADAPCSVVEDLHVGKTFCA